MSISVLAIGNSFSQDGTRYLYGIARAAGVDMGVVNLPIGGCPLSLHFRNAMGEKEAYSMEVNGMWTGFNVSIQEALLNRDWNVVTLQQVSHFSNKYETYQPYLDELITLVRQYAPKAKILLQETWGYKPDSKRLTEFMKYPTHGDMHRDVHAAYMQAVEQCDVDGYIPSGTLFDQMVQDGTLPCFFRDDIHASFGLGRYALGLVWFKKLTGKSVTGNTFRDFDEPIDEENIATVQRMVDALL